MNRFKYSYPAANTGTALITTGRRSMALLALMLCISCQKPTAEFAEKAPRPVTIMTLTQSVPVASFSASGSVNAWKTEDIGFEVAGRVKWVLEPGRDIDGRVVDPDDNLISQGTPLAQLDSARFEIALESASADLEVARLNKESIQIRLTDSLPAELMSAEADLRLAMTEYERMEKLKQQNAASRSEYDQARNLLQTRQSAITTLKASQKQTEAELKSAEAQIKRAEQALRDAERDLANTTLYASFQGQISQVMVVPGSVVAPGAPVLTLQMTNPIKVEVELSAKQSREMRRQRSLPVSFELPDGSFRNTNAFVYNIDASADPSMRTFTLTTLLLNEKIGIVDANGFKDDLGQQGTIASSADVWPLRLNRMMGTSDKVLLVEEKSIHRDDQGSYVFMVANAKLRDRFPHLVKVRRQPIVENQLRIPFLGNWVFRSVAFVDEHGAPIEIDLDSLYVGQLVPDNAPPSNWDGESVVLSADSQWMLRPGDLVTVNLSDQVIDTGFYVPIESLDENNGESSLFVVDQSVARRVPVTLRRSDNLDMGSQVGVQSDQLIDGMQVIVGGVHYLRDGEAITVVSQVPN